MAYLWESPGRAGGLPHEKMKHLVIAITKAGKVSCLEVVRYTEQECAESASLAIECGFDYLMGFPGRLDRVGKVPIGIRMEDL